MDVSQALRNQLERCQQVSAKKVNSQVNSRRIGALTFHPDNLQFTVLLIIRLQAAGGLFL